MSNAVANEVPAGPDPVAEEISKARIRLLFEYGFFGIMATSLKIVEAPWCRTLATDGRHLYYNREFVKNLTYQGLKFGLAHEVLHVALDHLGRRQGRDPKLWNMAIDYVTNATLKHEKCGVLPPNVLIDARYTHLMTAEEVYDDLVKRSSTITIKIPYDDHLSLPGDSMDDNDEGGEGEEREVKVRVLGDGDGPPIISRDEMEEIRNQVAAEILRAAQTTSSQGGSVPEGVRRKINQFDEPKMNWRAMLNAHNRSAIKGNFTFRRIGRRTHGLGGQFILPAQDVLEEVDLAAAIDCSGSVSDEMLRDFISECHGIMRSFQSFKFRLMTFDTQIYAYQEFNPQNIHTLKRYAAERLQGNGGTRYPAVWDFLKAKRVRPKRLAIFSDGEPNSEGWGDPMYCDTLFVIHSSKAKAPFGRTVAYEPRSMKRSAR